MISLRSAEAADVEGIAAIVQDVWGHDVLRAVCRAQIGDDASALWVAAEDGEIAGFLSAFLTVAGDRRRWEVDLIAVRRASQGQGLGTRLIRRACEVGRLPAASLTRALIRVENVPSQKAFENAGFATDGRRHRLFVWPPEPGEETHSYAGPVDLLPVDTLTYRGLWIEGLTSVPAEKQRHAVKAARSIVFEKGRANAGAVIPADEESRLASDLRDQARMHGEYHWFERKDRNVRRET